MTHARQFRWAALAALLLGVGCVPFEPPPQPGAPLRPPRATLSEITAPPRGADELRHLPDTQPGLLRRAWLLMRSQRAKQAIQVLNRVLDRTRPGPSERSLALYLRGHAFQLSGDRVRAREDLRQARTLAIRAPLRDRCTRELQKLGEPVVASNARKPPPASPKFTIIPRRTWNAARPVMRRMNPMQGIRRLTIHHTANLSRSTSHAVVATQIRGIQQFHVAQNSWGDIGYHYLIDPAGRVWEGRDTRYQGAHAGGANNRHNVGICLLGRFIAGSGGQHPTPAQVRAMEHLVLWLRLRHDLPGHAVLTHKEIKSKTDCPGSRLQLQVNRMRRRHAAFASRHVPGSTPGGSR